MRRREKGRGGSYSLAARVRVQHERKRQAFESGRVRLAVWPACVQLSCRVYVQFGLLCGCRLQTHTAPPPPHPPSPPSPLVLIGSSKNNQKLCERTAILRLGNLGAGSARFFLSLTVSRSTLDNRQEVRRVGRVLAVPKEELEEGRGGGISRQHICLPPALLLPLPF